MKNKLQFLMQTVGSRMTMKGIKLFIIGVVMFLVCGPKVQAQSIDQTPTVTSTFLDFSQPLVDGYAQIGVIYNCPDSLATTVQGFYIHRYSGGYTLVEATEPIPITSQIGVLYVPSNGLNTVIQLRFEHDYDKGDYYHYYTDSIELPSYHFIGSLAERNSRHTPISDPGYSLFFPRYNVFGWQSLIYGEDPVKNDYFEVQRAYQSDFSDAETLAVIAMNDTVAPGRHPHPGWQNYYYVDSTEGAWWNPVRDSDVVYYRVRRSSSAVWGWTGHQYIADDFSYNSYHPLGVMPFAEKEQHGTFVKAADFEQSRKVDITLNLYASGLLHQESGVTYWDKNQKLVIQKIMQELNDTLWLEVPHDSIETALYRAAWVDSAYVDTCVLHVHYTDYANTPCVHYTYHAFIDTTGVTVKRGFPKHPYYTSAPLIGDTIYYTDAANLKSLIATQNDYADHVLLTWEPTDGEVGMYKIETRPNNDTAEWKVLADSLTQCWYRDYTAYPETSFDWLYQVTMTYTCNGNTKSSSGKTLGSRLIYGKVSGYVHYEDGTGCPGVTVTASRVDDGETVQSIVTDTSGYFLLDSLLYLYGVEYAITPTSQTAEFRYNNTSSATATVRLTHDRCIVSDIDFDNISSVRFSGRILYENSTVPVRDAHFLVNGQPVMNGKEPYKTDASGNFQFNVPKGTGFTLQATKEGHTFVKEGFVRIDGDSVLTLDAPLDGVRIYDQTKVRLIGRLVGGNTQGQRTLGFGLSTNNLGDDLQMVLELEGDNISQLVHIPSDLTISEIDTVLPHVVVDSATVDTVGATTTLMNKKRIVIRPDIRTGEYAVDLFPAKYKIVQATAKGYSTLYANGKTSEMLDLTDAPLHHQTISNKKRKVYCNETYSIIYHSPIQLTCAQQVNGQDVAYFGEKEMKHKNLNNTEVTLPLINLGKDSCSYRLGAPVFKTGQYTFHVTAFEAYYYNNNTADTRVEKVLLQGGALKVYSNMHQADNTEIQSVSITSGDAYVTVPVNNVSFTMTGQDALRGIDLSYKYEGSYTEKQAVRGYITGNQSKGEEFVTYNAGNDNLVLLDILRDPPGAHSYAYLDQGTTYYFSQTKEFNLDFSLSINMGLGSHFGTVIGAFVGLGGGAFTGLNTEASSIVSTTITPVHIDYYNKNVHNYTCTLNQRIETGHDTYSVGAGADVFIGISQNAYYGLTDAVKVIDRVTYDKTKNKGIIVVAKAANDSTFLVIGTEIEVGTYAKSSFAYTQDYIENTILVQLQQLRNATTNADTIKAYDANITQWKEFLKRNEKEKVSASFSSDSILRQTVGNWSVGGITSVAHEETYEYSHQYSKFLNYDFGFGVSGGGSASSDNNIGNDYNTVMNDWNQNTVVDNANVQTLIESLVPGLQFSLALSPTFDFAWHKPSAKDTTHVKKAGFVLETDEYGHMDVSVHRIVEKKVGFNNDAKTDHENAAGKKDSLYYGSYVYFLNGGASRCPYEPKEYTHYYSPGTALSNGTLKLENQKIDINVHERSEVPADQAAIFNLKLTNEGEMPYGDGTSPITFYLKQKDGSNPLGAKILIDGMPLTGEGRPIRLTHGEVINKTMEVYAGEGYDFENIELVFESPCDIYNRSYCTFSVHYTPVSCPVRVVTPHDLWVLNTLSPRDSSGWYLPMVIDGYDVHYKGFDHIELQYKLATQSEDEWVNLCSYYYDESLYKAASGNKELIRSGKIENIRFYGERDPMEQQYNLRAVSFCRHGNGFITRASEVLTGMKDTRCPRVFGEPQPTDAVLHVGENMSLRFNEAIAGNYLDEDNNFQVLGTINSTGITTGTSLHFDGTDDSYAATLINRSLAQKSFSVDMLVRPAQPKTSAVLFQHGKNGLEFGIDSSNRLYIQWGNGTPIYSKPLQDITDFMRVIVTYNHETDEVRFFAGTEEMTDKTQTVSIGNYNISEPLVFGRGLNGNMLEARLWNIAIGEAEIAETHMKRLTGLERGLTDYYPMNEGRGNSVSDKASGASLTLHGTAWKMREGISIRQDGSQPLSLNSDLLARSSIQDATLMLWFKTAEANGTVFSAGREKSADDKAYGIAIRFADGVLKLESDSNSWTIGSYADDEWHHLVLSISRTFNHTAIYIDGILVNSFSATRITGISGEMFLGSDGYKGSIDDLAMFEQALPKSLILDFDNIMLSGEEMGLIGFLPFEEQKENDNGIMETVFTPNDKRVFKDSEGNVVNKVVPLLIGDLSLVKADKTDCAPIKEHEHLTKLNFDWSYNNDELLINLKMHDREINKQSIYVTVRDVEDLRGNPMASPVTWTAFVDRNTLKWESKSIRLHHDYEDVTAQTQTIRIINTGGKRQQFTIDALPNWLSVSDHSGTLEPEEEKTLTLTFSPDFAVGEYSSYIYLTDENGLSEPLHVEMIVEAKPPYDDVDKNKYPNNMSICGQIKLMQNGATLFDNDNQDIVYALYRNECVGSTHVHVDEVSNLSNIYLTVYGDDSMTRKEVTFLLWQASTGKIINLTPNRKILFAHGYVYGCGDEEPVVFTTGGSETQNIELPSGWNWISFRLKLDSTTGIINQVMTANQPWTEGDIIKNPATQQFVTYSNDKNAFVGSFDTFNYQQIYMMYAKDGNSLNVNGEKLSESDLTVTFKGNGAWSPLPALLDKATSVTDALADYYDKASAGDVVKSHTQFAVFSSDNHWVGDLTALRPGEGYLFRRLGADNVDVHFYNISKTKDPKQAPAQPSTLNAQRYATNMTIICQINHENDANGDASLNGGLMAYIGDELVGVATQIDSLYFLTISSDAAGSSIEFRTDEGIVLVPTINDERPTTIRYSANSHHGSLKAPIVLRPGDSRPYKIIENNHVIIIRNNEKYDITGKKL